MNRQQHSPTCKLALTAHKPSLGASFAKIQAHAQRAKLVLKPLLFLQARSFASLTAIAAKATDLIMSQKPVSPAKYQAVTDANYLKVIGSACFASQAKTWQAIEKPVP